MKEFRADKENAKAVFEALLPDKNNRQRCLEFLAGTIRTLHKVAPDRWGITLYRDLVLVNCGRIEVLQVLSGLMHVIITADDLPRFPPDAVLEIYEGEGKGYYVSVRGSIAVEFSDDEAGVILPKLKKSHASLIRQVARSRLVSSRKKAHSPGVIQFLEDYLNQQLPQPAYFDPQQEETYRAYLSRWGSVIEFHDKLDIEAHDLFQRWRREHWNNGYFINRKSSSQLILHRASCRHPGDGEWSSSEAGHTLTKLKKACSTSVRELHQWAKQTSKADLEFCRDCQPEASDASTDPDEIEPGNLNEPLPDVEQTLVSVSEGRKKFVTHLRRERRSQIVTAKKEQALKETGGLRCEVCGFDFKEKYGKLGEGFAEAHHKMPLSVVEDEAETSLDDLAIICSNCHRMIHRTNPMESIEQLRRRLEL